MPLGPAPARCTTDLPPGDTLGWPVRELREGDRPADWIENERPADREGEEAQLNCAAAGTHAEPAPETPSETTDHSRRPPTDNAPRPPIDLRPIRYKVQFTATQEYVDAMGEALDLLGHEMPSRDVAELHARAMKSLLAELRKKKRAETERPRSRKAGAREVGGEPAPAPAESLAAPARPAPEAGQPAPAAPARPAPEAGQPTPARQPKPPKPNRHIPAAVRREVWVRDDGQCAYVDAAGTRCRETARLQIHHRHAHAKGGEATVENLELRCAPHNDLAAELDFGRQHMARMRAS